MQRSAGDIPAAVKKASALWRRIVLTRVHVVIPVQCSELLAVVPGERVPGTAVVSAHSQPVEV